MKMVFSTLLSVILTISTCSVFAQNLTFSTTKLIVVQDNGGRDVRYYYDELGLLAPTSSKPQTTEAMAPFQSQWMAMEAMFPVTSVLLTPGYVASSAIQAPNLPPIFMIGHDDYSIQWLMKQQDRLRDIGALGLVVNVQTLQEFNALQSLVPDLPLSPVSGDDIAQRLNLQHYPVLITSISIMQ